MLNLCFISIIAVELYIALTVIKSWNGPHSKFYYVLRRLATVPHAAIYLSDDGGVR